MQSAGRLLALLALLLLLNGSCLPKCDAQLSYRVVVTENATFERLLLLKASLRTNFSSTVGLIQFDFRLLDVPASLREPARAVDLHREVKATNASAVIGDFFFFGMSIVTSSLGIPYFVASSNAVKAAENNGQVFVYGLDFSHLTVPLEYLCADLGLSSNVFLTDASAESVDFLNSEASHSFVHNVVAENTSDSEIFTLLNSQRDLLPSQSWVLHFSSENMNQVRRIFDQSARAGALRDKDAFIIPTVVEIEEHLQNVRQSSASIFTFRLDRSQRLNESELTNLLLQDCLNHYALAIEHLRLQFGRANYTILNALASVSMTGSTGVFNYTDGRRSNVTFNVMKADRTKGASDFFVEYAKFTDGAATPYEKKARVGDSLERPTVRFAAVWDAPYFYKGTDGRPAGLNVELIQLMAEHLGFKYEFIIVPDGKYGTLVNNSWNGIMQYLIDGKADISANFLSASSQRLRYVENSVGLRDTGIQAVVKRTVHQLDFFHIFYPFSWFVWVSIVFSMILLSVTLWVCDKISPNTEGKSMFSFMSSFFLVFSSFLMSKVETDPRKPSARLFTLLLWFSTLFYMTTYLSNLVPFLVKPDDSVPFTSIAELVNATGYKCVVSAGGSTYTALSRKWPELYAKAMAEWPNEFQQQSVADILNLIEADNKYVWIGPSSSIAYAKTTDCNLKTVGPLEEMQYETMLMSKNFAYKSQVNAYLNSILTTDFAKLEVKYFGINRCPTGTINPLDKESLDFNYFAGHFALVGVGALLGFLYILIDWVQGRAREWLSNKRAKLKYGKIYTAEIMKVEKEGVWVQVKGYNQVFFIANNSLSADPMEVKNAKRLGLHPSSEMTVQYFGVDSATNNRIFTRLFEESDWYVAEQTQTVESDSD